VFCFAQNKNLPSRRTAVSYLFTYHPTGTRLPGRVPG